MAERQRVVAELGRPETPDETAARKAESSRIYRSSQTTRNLVAALIATLIVVAVIIFAVPRGTPAPQDPLDISAAAERVSSSEGRTAISPELPEDWTATRATIDGEGSVRTWLILTTPTDEEIPGFLRIAQGFDADEAWPARVLSGAAPVGAVTIDGIPWDRYELDPSRTGNISVALSTRAGADTILVYGQADAATLEQVAGSVTDQVRELQEEAQ
ncbi:hypothetical protein GCM10009775_34620 [Microbacterium aoyamense]|uniref:Amino acid transporter n=1 Tax=Microbacterium aoyamense TaxID=344166 RepID=A0ABN2PZP0_9MICO|nr:DUF4245 family protein [Microbacterium aoyamense]